MLELLRTTNPVMLSFVESLLKDSGIDYFVADRHVTAIDGLIGAFPFRVMVASQDAASARRTLIAADLGAELLPWTGGGNG